MEFLGWIYSALESYRDKLSHIFITGFTRFRELPLVESLDGMTDMTFYPRFKAVCGFTVDEIKLTFREHLEADIRESRQWKVFDPDATTDHNFRQDHGKVRRVQLGRRNAGTRSA
ncbi:MAG: AAA family ATPase [Deltaproteobacteria bacterium]|jgi:hypothetical protein|nr:AAA family ATPase [Deltaproteobacteria bacterium]